MQEEHWHRSVYVITSDEPHWEAALTDRLFWRKYGLLYWHRRIQRTGGNRRQVQPNNGRAAPTPVLPKDCGSPDSKSGGQ